MDLRVGYCGSPVYIPFLPTCHLNHNDDIVLTQVREHRRYTTSRHLRVKREGRGRRERGGEEGAEK